MRYFIGFLATISLIIVAIVLIFNGGGAKQKVPSTSKTLSSYASTDAQVQLTIDGPIRSNQEHQQMKITVGQNAVTYQQFAGYNNGLVNTQTFANNQQAYNSFLHALTYAGFNKTTNTAATSEVGYCALGDRYVFELMQDGKDIERTWATSCGNPKTYGGNLDTTVYLFEAQVPNFGTLSQNFVY